MSKICAAAISSAAKMAASMEADLKRRPPWLESRVNGQMWDELKKYAKPHGEAFTDHLFGK